MNVKDYLYGDDYTDAVGGDTDDMKTDIEEEYDETKNKKSGKVYLKKSKGRDDIYKAQKEREQNIKNNISISLVNKKGKTINQRVEVFNSKPRKLTDAQSSFHFEQYQNEPHEIEGEIEIKDEEGDGGEQRDEQDIEGAIKRVDGLLTVIEDEMGVKDIGSNLGEKASKHIFKKFFYSKTILQHIVDFTNIKIKSKNNLILRTNREIKKVNEMSNRHKSDRTKDLREKVEIVVKRKKHQPYKRQVVAVNGIIKPVKIVESVTMKTLKHYFAALIMICAREQRTIKSYWKLQNENSVEGSAWIQILISRDRFLEVHRNLNYKIDFIVSETLRNIQTHLIPPKKLTVDETLVAFGGLNPWWVYMKDKPRHIGTKVFCLASATGIPFVYAYLIFKKKSISQFNENGKQVEFEEKADDTTTQKTVKIDVGVGRVDEKQSDNQKTDKGDEYGEDEHGEVGVIKNLSKLDFKINVDEPKLEFMVPDYSRPSSASIMVQKYKRNGDGNIQINNDDYGDEQERLWESIVYDRKGDTSEMFTSKDIEKVLNDTDKETKMNIRDDLSDNSYDEGMGGADELNTQIKDEDVEQVLVKDEEQEQKQKQEDEEEEETEEEGEGGLGVDLFDNDVLYNSNEVHETKKTEDIKSVEKKAEHRTVKFNPTRLDSKESTKKVKNEKVPSGQDQNDFWVPNFKVSFAPVHLELKDIDAMYTACFQEVFSGSSVIHFAHDLFEHLEPSDLTDYYEKSDHFYAASYPKIMSRSTTATRGSVGRWGNTVFAGGKKGKASNNEFTHYTRSVVRINKMDLNNDEDAHKRRIRKPKIPPTPNELEKVVGVNADGPLLGEEAMEAAADAYISEKTSKPSDKGHKERVHHGSEMKTDISTLEGYREMTNEKIQTSSVFKVIDTLLSFLGTELRNYHIYGDKWFTSEASVKGLMEKGVVYTGASTQDRFSELFKKRASVEAKNKRKLEGHAALYGKYTTTEGEQMPIKAVSFVRYLFRRGTRQRTPQQYISTDKRSVAAVREVDGVFSVDLVEDYDTNKRGVDIVDQYLSTCQFPHRFTNFTRPLLHYCMHVAIINTLGVMKFLQYPLPAKGKNQSDFFEKLARSLVKTYEEMYTDETRKPHKKIRISDYFHGKKERERCSFCRAKYTLKKLDFESVNSKLQAIKSTLGYNKKDIKETEKQLGEMEKELAKLYKKTNSQTTWMCKSCPIDNMFLHLECFEPFHALMQKERHVELLFRRKEAKIYTPPPKLTNKERLADYNHKKSLEDEQKNPEKHVFSIQDTIRMKDSIKAKREKQEQKKKKKEEKQKVARKQIMEMNTKQGKIKKKAKTQKHVMKEEKQEEEEEKVKNEQRANDKDGKQKAEEDEQEEEEEEEEDYYKLTKKSK